MAYVKNNPEEEAELSSAPGGGSVGGSAPQSQGAPASNTGTGFVNLQTVLGLNAGQGANLANSLSGDVASRGGAVNGEIGQYGADASKAHAADLQSFDGKRYGNIQQHAADAASQARALGSYGGQEALLSQKYGQGANGGYSGGQQGFDAFLAGAEGGNQMQNTSNAYGGLDRALGLAGQTYAPPSASIERAQTQPKPSGINYAPTGFGNTPPEDETRQRPPRQTMGQRYSPFGF